MITQELINYIKEKRGEGLSDKKIRESLLRVGWQVKDVERGFNEADGVFSKNFGTKEGFFLTGPFGLLDKALNVTRENFWRYGGILIIPVIFLSVVSFFLDRFLPSGRDVVAWLGQASFSDILLVLLLVIVLIVVSAWANAALLLAIKFRFQDISIGGICLRALKLLGRYIVVVLLVGLMFFGGLVPFLLPAFFFIVWLYFSEYVLVDEGIGGVRALVRSREYMRGRELGVLGRLLFSTVVMVPFAWLAEMVRIGIFSLSGETFLLASEIAANIVILPAIIILTVFYFLLYEDLKLLREKKEGKVPESENFRNWGMFFIIWGIALLLGLFVLFLYLFL